MQEANAPLLSASRLHSNVAPGSEVNEKLAFVRFVDVGGFAVIVVLGAIVSTVHVYAAGVASVFPAASLARTRNVCCPWLSPV